MPLKAVRQPRCVAKPRENAGSRHHFNLRIYRESSTVPEPEWRTTLSAVIVKRTGAVAQKPEKAEQGLEKSAQRRLPNPEEHQ